MLKLGESYRTLAGDVVVADRRIGHLTRCIYLKRGPYLYGRPNNDFQKIDYWRTVDGKYERKPGGIQDITSIGKKEH